MFMEKKRLPTSKHKHKERWSWSWKGPSGKTCPIKNVWCAINASKRKIFQLKHEHNLLPYIKNIQFIIWFLAKFNLFFLNSIFCNQRINSFYSDSVVNSVSHYSRKTFPRLTGFISFKHKSNFAKWEFPRSKLCSQNFRRVCLTEEKLVFKFKWRITDPILNFLFKFL